MLPPLDVDRDLTTLAPIGMEQRPMPVGPAICCRSRGMVADPDDFFVRRHREWNPRSVDVVLPEEMVGDDGAGRVKHGHDPLQWEPFVSLQVQKRREYTGEPRVGVARGE